MSMAARVAWAYLPCHADKDGRLKDSAFALKAAIFPADALDMETILSELAGKQHIVRYVVAGRRYIQIRNFTRYQTPHVRETPSVIPAPVETEASPVQGLPKAVPGTPIPDLDPGPDPSPEKGPDQAPPPPTFDLSPPDRPNGLWFARDWLTKFKAAWEARGGPVTKAFYADTGDSKATATLDAELGRLPEGVRLDAQLRALSMFTAFFAGKGKETERRGWPFSFFVQDFGRLRMEAATRSRTPVERPPEQAIPYHLRKREAPVKPPEVPHADP